MSETLEFPAVEPVLIEPKARTEVAVAASAALDLAKVDLTDVALAQFGRWQKKVAETKANLSTLALDLSNQSKVNEAKSLRERWFNAPRAEARKVSKELKSKLAKVSKAIGEEETKIVSAYDEAEKPLTEQIDAAQKRIDDEKEAARLAEEQRLDGLRAAADAILAKWVERASGEGMTAERIGAGIVMLQGLEMPAELGDVAAYWASCKSTTVNTMERLKAEAQRREEAARAEAQRLENERIARELAERQRLLDEQAAALRRQQQEIEAAQARAAAQAAAEAASAAGTVRPAVEGGEPSTSREAAQDSPAQAPQQVLKAEAETPDATDREVPVIASPVGGPMGAGQPAAAGPVVANEFRDCRFSDASPGLTFIGMDLASGPDFSIETSEHEAVEPPAGFAPLPTGEAIDLQVLLADALELVRHAADAFNSKFPSQPKPGVEWWREMSQLVERVLPTLELAVSGGLK